MKEIELKSRMIASKLDVVIPVFSCKHHLHYEIQVQEVTEHLGMNQLDNNRFILNMELVFKYSYQEINVQLRLPQLFRTAVRFPSPIFPWINFFKTIVMK